MIDEEFQKTKKELFFALRELKEKVGYNNNIKLIADDFTVDINFELTEATLVEKYIE